MPAIAQRFVQRLDRLPGGSRLAWVAGGYLVAVLLAALAVLALAAATDGPDRELSSGMHAFADALVFVFALACFSTVPSGLALYFLRPVRWAWPAFSAAAWAAAATGLLAVAAVHLALEPSGLGSVLAVLRILHSPLCMALFVAVGLFSPSPASTRGLYTAAAVEGVTVTYGFVHWLLPLLAPDVR